jgi:PhnB protein
MTNPVSPIPEGQRLFAYLAVHGAARAIDFYTAAFLAKESFRLEMGDKIAHAEISFEGITVMIADEFPEMGVVAPERGASVSILIYVEDVDQVAARAVAAGAVLKQPVHDAFYGDRVADVLDPFGHRWLFHSRRELVSPEEMRRRMAEQV